MNGCEGTISIYLPADANRPKAGVIVRGLRVVGCRQELAASLLSGATFAFLKRAVKASAIATREACGDGHVNAGERRISRQ
jgi:hypothetical protein